MDNSISTLLGFYSRPKTQKILDVLGWLLVVAYLIVTIVNFDLIKVLPMCSVYNAMMVSFSCEPEWLQLVLNFLALPISFTVLIMSIVAFPQWQGLGQSLFAITWIILNVLAYFIALRALVRFGKSILKFLKVKNAAN